MKKDVKDIKKANEKLSLVLIGTTLLSISAIGFSLDTMISLSNNDTFKLNTMLKEYGIDKEDLSFYEAGYLLGEKTSYSLNIYEFSNEIDTIDEESLYDSLKSVYTGKCSDEYFMGLEDGIEDGKNKATLYYKENGNKVRVFKINN